MVIEFLPSPDLATEHLLSLSSDARHGPSESRVDHHEAKHDSHFADAREDELLPPATYTAHVNQLIEHFSRLCLCIDTVRLILGPLIREGA